MNVVLYFGTFNPIHLGHLVIANYIAESTDIAEVWFVVSPQSPDKRGQRLLAASHRFEMVRIAIEGNLKLKVSDIEFGLSKPSYTSETLKVLQEKHPDKTFSLVMGEDNLRSFNSWFQYKKILASHKIYVYPRLITDQERLNLEEEIHFPEGYNNIIFCKDVPVMKMSSSFIRKSIVNNEDVSHLLIEKVYRYLIKNRLYK